MIVDYLRYLAFRGRLRPFFDGALYNYADPAAITGQHLRFAPNDLEERSGWLQHVFLRRFLGDPLSDPTIAEEIIYRMGLAPIRDHLTVPEFRIGGPPSTFVYKELDMPRVEIIVDIHPVYWSDRYTDRRSYEGVPIIYRRAGPAKGSIASGDKLFDRERGRADYGTLCGVFSTTGHADFALTCGHVVRLGSEVIVERRRRIWRLPISSHFISLGETRFVALPGPAKGASPVETQLDAALIPFEPSATGSENSRSRRHATIKPLSMVIQEEPLRFRGARTVVDKLARVLAVTVRKSIDLFRDGELRDVGDVLMVGHRHPMYIAQRVSRPGDSGAAVRGDRSHFGQLSEENQWHGMILGSDEGGAYATYAEHLWAWAAQEIGDADMEFFLEA